MALHVGDDIGIVIKNRKKYLSSFGLELSNLICLNQTHSSNIKIVSSKDAGAGAFEHDNAILNCDAVITGESNLVLAIMTADCVPVLLWDDTKGVVAAAHAGWRGTADEIVKKTVMQMSTEFGCEIQNIKADIGASIGECCYEVGTQTAELCGCAGASRLDLKAINHVQLTACGVLTNNIQTSTACTSCEKDRYFSYRADGASTGRFMSWIVIKS